MYPDGTEDIGYPRARRCVCTCSLNINANCLMNDFLHGTYEVQNVCPQGVQLMSILCSRQSGHSPTTAGILSFEDVLMMFTQECAPVELGIGGVCIEVQELLISAPFYKPVSDGNFEDRESNKHVPRLGVLWIVAHNPR